MLHTCAIGGQPVFFNRYPGFILVLKKCKKFDDVLFINASQHFEKGKRQNRLRDGEDGEPNDIEKIVATYKNRLQDDPRYSRRVSMEEIEKNDFNLNISRYVSTATSQEIIDLEQVHKNLVAIEKIATDARNKHNEFLKELGLPCIL